ncbi:excalibur calcium-binding domain-containing protein [Subtercola sp. YIM 133946]|uniref:excalibur calcium-binding domain-containing protein n=1 Tax=Subtercola sp. YIM 133946 TaxID=3118909 RepID=UPI002F9568D9
MKHSTIIAARAAAVAAAVVIGLGMIVPATAQAVTPGVSTRAAQSVAVGDRMSPGETLQPSEQLASAAGGFRFVVQGDGNAVVYTESSQALWNSSTFVADSRLVMQTDGNLVLYKPSGAPAWNSGTANNPGAYVVMQSDGNLVIYAGGVAKWNSFAASHPAPAAPVSTDTLAANAQLTANTQLTSGANSAVMQGDGNFVVYASGRAPWSSRTNSGTRLVMQGDGNAVVYSAGGKAVWNSGTAGNAGARMVMQGDGNLVIYSSSNRPLWNSFAASAPPAPVAPTPPASVYYANCTAAWQAGAAPIRRGQPGYRSALDRDNDGVACEVRPY